MARLRKFTAYRKLERPYTRYSKYKKNNFVRARPGCRIVRHVMGQRDRDDWDYKVVLQAKDNRPGFQVRDNAIEAARLAANRELERRLGKIGYKIRLRIYPHHILRENPLASGAGADRLSTGMKMSFGKPVGVAAQVPPGKEVLEIFVDKKHLELAKKACKQAAHRLPSSFYINVEQLREPTKSAE